MDSVHIDEYIINNHIHLLHSVFQSQRVSHYITTFNCFRIIDEERGTYSAQEV